MSLPSHFFDLNRINPYFQKDSVELTEDMGERGVTAISDTPLNTGFRISFPLYLTE